MLAESWAAIPTGPEHWVMTEGVGDVVCLSLNPSHREAVVQKLFSDAHEALIV